MPFTAFTAVTTSTASHPAGAPRLRRPALVSLLGLACLAGPLQAQETTRVRMALDWVLQGPQAPFLMQVENGCFRKAGLEVPIDRGFGSGDTVVKVGAGTYDVGFADINAMMEYNAKQTNPDDRLVSFMMIYDGAALSIVTRRDTGIAKPADLVGKTIAAPPGDASRRLFPAFAKVNGIDPASVKWMNVAPELRETMLARKNADAIAGASFTAYMGSQAVGIPAKDLVVMRYSEFGSALYGSALFAKRSYLDSHKEALKGLTRCVVEGIQKSTQDPDAAIAALHKRDPLINRAIEKERLQLSLDWSIVTPWVRENGLGDIDPKRMERAIQETALAFDIPAPRAADVFTAELLPAASLRQVRK